MPPDFWREGWSARVRRHPGTSPAALSGGSRVSRHRAAAGREPCFRDELGQSPGTGAAPLPGVDPAEVEWVECDELCTFIGKKKRFAGSGGLLIVLPNASAGGRWAIAAPKAPKTFLRNYLAALT